MGKLIGIDLGTTNSCVAVMQQDQPVVIPNSEGSRTTPSMVSFTGAETLIGQLAKRAHIANAQNTVYAVKRLMGRKYSDPDVLKMKSHSAFSIIESDNGDAWVEVQEKKMSAVEVSSLILRKMKQVAEEYLGEEVTDAVITVPAYFDDAQRQATRDAGKIAGLEVRRIVNEPTAAALAYGFAKEQADEIIAVYDLGGGTFDISILELSTGMFQVRSTAGNTFLGGEDFDRRLMESLIESFRSSTGIDIGKDQMALQRVKEAAEKAKMELSASPETDVNLPFLAVNEAGPQHLVATIAREEFELMVMDLVNETLEPCRQALKDAGLTPADITHVVLVGGQTRMPLVQRKVEAFFGKKPYKGVNPDEIVAMGACLQGGIIEGTVEDVLLLDVVPLSIGVETSGGIFTRVIGRNTPVPTRKTLVFTTAVDNQPFVNIHVVQGEREMVTDNKSLANFQLMGIPPAPRGVPQIEVTFELDANGILSVTAKDLGTGKAQSVRVTPTHGLTQDAIDRIRAEGELHADEDRRKRAGAEMRNQAETLIYTTERALEEYSSMLEPHEIEEITADLKWCKNKLNSSDEEILADAIRRLELSAHLFSEVIYRDFLEK